MSAAFSFQWSSAARTHVGKVRELNEDSCAAVPERGLWVVADGMGGHARGDMASRMVIDALLTLPSPTSLADYIEGVTTRLQEVNQTLRREALLQGEQLIGSTVVVLVTFERHCAYLWAGDSRAYLLRGSHLRQLSRDHNQIQELIALGVLHPADARALRTNVITRAVGAADILELDVETLEVQDGDLFLLCSDGLSNEVSEHEIAAELLRGNCEQIATTLLNLALTRGAPDNVTLIVVRADDQHTTERTLLNPLFLSDAAE